MVEGMTETQCRRSELIKTLGFTKAEWVTGSIYAALLGSGIVTLIDSIEKGAFDIGPRYRIAQRTWGMRGWQFLAVGLLISIPAGIYGLSKVLRSSQDEDAPQPDPFDAVKKSLRISGSASIGTYFCIRCFSFASDLRGQKFPRGLRWVGGRTGPALVCALGSITFFIHCLSTQWARNKMDEIAAAREEREALEKMG